MRHQLHNFYWFLYSRLLNKSLIYAIGDSHTQIFRGKRLFVAHDIGPATAHNLKNRISTTDSNRKLFQAMKWVREKDIVLMVFGEVDCRIHIYNQHKKTGQSISSTIKKTIANYGEALNQLKGLRLFVLSVVPPSRSELPLTTAAKGIEFYADSAARNRIYKEFNERLKELCEENGYKYINIYSKTVGRDGFAKKKYARDEIHLNSKAVELVKETIK